MAEPASLRDILPTFATLAGRESAAGFAAPLDGRSLVPLLDGKADDEGVRLYAEYTAEGALAPVFMIREGRWKYIASRPDPDQLYDLAADPAELADLATDPAHAATLARFRGLAAERWDAARLEAQVLESQLTRLTVWQALREGKYYPWDYQPLRDASEQYMRNHKDLNVLEKSSRFPPPPMPEPKRK